MVAVLFPGVFAFGQQAEAGGGSDLPAPASLPAALQSMESRAGVVFAGEVASIRQSEDAGVVDVVFQVEDCVRGCSAGQEYVMREAFALWRNSPCRYRAGQRALWMLYAPNAGGLSSPVDGMLGVMPLNGRGGATQVDTRWVRAGQARQDADTYLVPYMRIAATLRLAEASRDGAQ